MSRFGLSRQHARDLVLPRDIVGAPARVEAGAPAGPPVRLESLRFEHAGRAHRLHLRVHEGGTGLVVADAERLAWLAAHDVPKLAGWMAAVRAGRATSDAAALERDLWGQPVLTGSGPVKGFDAWLPAVPAGWRAPAAPIVATVEVGDGPASAGAAHAIRRLADLCMPHVVLRPAGGASGEGLRDSLVAAVRVAEDLGLVAGLAAPAHVVDADGALERLAEVGLDHLALTVAGADAATHDAVLGGGAHARLENLCSRAARADLPLTADVPLVSANWASAAELVASLRPRGMLGATAWAVVGGAAGGLETHALRQAATTLEHAADVAALPVTWCAPVRARDLVEDIAGGPRTEGDRGVRVTADGTLLAPRGHASCGTVAWSWTDILASPGWQASANITSGAQRCGACPGLALCLGGCPADPVTWA